jgi:Predicted hydrolase (HAD superfamily)
MLKHLKSFGCATTQDDFQKTMRKIRSEMTKEGKVMRYTEIRLSAIRMEMEKYMDPSRICHKQILESYDVWEANRHIAAEKYLYSDTIPMLEEIKINHPGAIIAAITNGKGNPFEMKSICNYFDFCTSGEDKNVFPYRKPHKGIYKIALQRFEELSQRKGPHVGSKLCWIHIGDDLANDIGASARCGANPIWVDLGDDYGQTASKRSTIMAQPSWSTLTKDDLQKRKILDNEAKLLISKRVTKLSMLPTAIREISESLPQ